ncbi:Retrovirus-related Pol polyprotein from transposon 17.6, partial [Mucuna pruriens]
MDAYSCYNQIQMHPSDEEKTTFIIEEGVFCYKVMPFGLKNAGVTYQRLMDRVFEKTIRVDVEVYVDVMVVKSEKANKHCETLEHVFKTLKDHQLKLNPEKCSFRVQAGKFLGFMLTERGTEANPDKYQAIIGTRSPQGVKEVQQLMGRIVALSQNGTTYLWGIKEREEIHLDKRVRRSLSKTENAITAPPVLTRSVPSIPLCLYIFASDNAISAIFVQERDGEQRLGPETRYQKIEKAALALVTTSRRFANSSGVGETRPSRMDGGMERATIRVRYFIRKTRAHQRMVAWSVQLSEFDISSSSNYTRSGARIILEGPTRVLIEQSLHFEFRANNNQAEYEALLAGMKLAQELGTKKLTAKNDLKLVTGQINGDYQAKDP